MESHNLEQELIDIESLFDELWPLNRSLSGDGVRQSIDILARDMPLKRFEIPSGTQVHDWEVPPEWNCKEAWIEDPNGKRICNFESNNLHLVGYSIPFDGTLTLEELKPHLHVHPLIEDAVPYVTSYYKERWGFCLSKNDFDQLASGNYRVHIDSELNTKGHLSRAESFLQGSGKKEVFFSTYLCHPSMANNELSGPLACYLLYKRLEKKKGLRHNYRFLFGPETIGAVANLVEHGKAWKENLLSGLVVSCVALEGEFVFKKSRQGDSITDRMLAHVHSHQESGYRALDFFPKGSDERQYCSAGYNLPVAALIRGMYYEYPEYHSSHDNKELISFKALQGTVDLYEKLVDALELDAIYINNEPYGEPQLGKRGLYPNLSTPSQRENVLDTMMWLLSYSDGNHSLLEIAEISKISILEYGPIVTKLLEAGLISRRD